MENTKKTKEGLKVKVIGDGTYTDCQGAHRSIAGITIFTTKDGRRVETNAHTVITQPN